MNCILFCPVLKYKSPRLWLELIRNTTTIVTPSVDCTVTGGYTHMAATQTRNIPIISISPCVQQIRAASTDGSRVSREIIGTCQHGYGGGGLTFLLALPPS